VHTNQFVSLLIYFYQQEIITEVVNIHEINALR